MSQEILIKNIPHSEVVQLSSLVEYADNQVVSRTLAQNPAMNLTLFAFAAGEGLSTHESTGDAMIQVLEGQARITIDAKEYLVAQGETVVMPARTPHAVDADARFKMLLIVVKPTA